MDPSTSSNISLITSNIVIGSNDLSGHGLLVGTDFAHNLGLQLGDKVAIYSPRDLEEMDEAHKKGEELAITGKDFELRGIFDAGWWEYNSSFIIASLDQAQDLYRLDDDVHGLMVMLTDPYKAELVRAQLEQQLGANLVVTTWSEDNSAMLAVLVEKNVMLYILFFIVIVAAFGITCTLITFVVLKTRDIGVMKALGATGRQIMWIFLSQSMGVSVMGVAVGLGAGILGVVYRNPFLHLMRKLTGIELFPAKIYMLTELPARIVPGDIAIICGGSFLICLLAAAFPAWHASRLRPVEALRHD
jgi:lipoprotein-releasing system permease protein